MTIAPKQKYATPIAYRCAGRGVPPLATHVWHDPLWQDPLSFSVRSCCTGVFGVVLLLKGRVKNLDETFANAMLANKLELGKIAK